MPVYVKDLMVKKVITVSPNVSIKKAAEVLRDNNISALIVVNKNNPVGIITESDIIEKVVSKNKIPSRVKVKDIMSHPLITIREDSTLLEAARKLRRNNIKRLPVIDKNGKLVGIISVTDIAVNSPEMLDILEKRLEMREVEPTIKEKTTVGICESCGNYSDELRDYDGSWLCPECLEEVKEE